MFTLDTITPRESVEFITAQLFSASLSVVVLESGHFLLSWSRLYDQISNSPSLQIKFK